MEIFLSQEREDSSWQEVNISESLSLVLIRNTDYRPMHLTFISGSRANRPKTHQKSLSWWSASWLVAQRLSVVLRLFLRESVTVSLLVTVEVRRTPFCQHG